MTVQGQERRNWRTALRGARGDGTPIIMTVVAVI